MLFSIMNDCGGLEYAINSKVKHTHEIRNPLLQQLP